LDVLQAYRWPGNVRELFSVLDATLANVLHESTFFAKHLPQNVRIEVARSRFDREMTDNEPPTKAFDSPDVLPGWQKFRRAHIEDGEKKYLKALISLCRGNVLKAAQYSGLSRPHLYGLLRKYGLST
jgi:two-component system NtrC family response regulator